MRQVLIDSGFPAYSNRCRLHAAHLQYIKPYYLQYFGHIFNKTYFIQLLISSLSPRRRFIFDIIRWSEVTRCCDKFYSLGPSWFSAALFVLVYCCCSCSWHSCSCSSASSFLFSMKSTRKAFIVLTSGTQEKQEGNCCFDIPSSGVVEREMASGRCRLCEGHCLARVTMLLGWLLWRTCIRY